MKTSDRIFSTGKPETKSVARSRQVLAAGAAILSAAGLGLGVKAVTGDPTPRPTHGVEVQVGDTGVVWNEASKVAAAQGGDTRDVVDQIYADSPDLEDGLANPGDVLRVPMTDDEIAQREQQAHSNDG
jgi:hypothetical protein